MEDDLNILKVEYFRNHCLDHIKMSNLGFGDQTKLQKKTSKGRRPQNIKIEISQPPIMLQF
jgi:hypothetical protein